MSGINININNYFGGVGGGFGTGQSNGLWAGGGGCVQGGAGFNDILGDLFKILDRFRPGNFNFGNGSGGGCANPSLPAPINPPRIDCGHQPSGSLKVDGNKVTTAGGYTIEQLGQFEWKITGPDNKSTRIWGDPHVDEGDGGKWDFKKDSTFVLGDGTKINVSTKPWGNGGMTVTGGLEIISGNDRVVVSDIDKGIGKVGAVTQDGYAHANSFGGKDVFVMGRESDDWSHQGKEIIGSNNGGDSFILGKDLPTGRQQPDYSAAFNNRYMQLLNQLMQTLNSFNARPNPWGTPPYGGGREPWRDTRPADSTNDRSIQDQVRQGVRDAVRDFLMLFSAMSRFSRMADRMDNFRFQQRMV